MSGIGAVVPTDARAPAKERKTPERDRDDARQPRRPQPPREERDIAEAEKRSLDVEA
ncbi:MAG TPA: hypothetical protein VNW90_08110 [Acetobacteraceae bacterium]|jgi:hypothetical protein|nr:hypothetical protein [Acetobacteraceae bacterium]